MVRLRLRHRGTRRELVGWFDLLERGEERIRARVNTGEWSPLLQLRFPSIPYSGYPLPTNVPQRVPVYRQQQRAVVGDGGGRRSELFRVNIDVLSTHPGGRRVLPRVRVSPLHRARIAPFRELVRKGGKYYPEQRQVRPRTWKAREGLALRAGQGGEVVNACAVFSRMFGRWLALFKEKRSLIIISESFGDKLLPLPPSKHASLVGDAIP